MEDVNGFSSVNINAHSWELNYCPSVTGSQLLQDLNNNYSASASQYIQDLNNGYLEDINHHSSMIGFQPSETLNNLNEQSEDAAITESLSVFVIDYQPHHLNALDHAVTPGTVF